ncbi:hypothetical protein H4R24_000384 [Coemansia sp. RSA 988]|nr:hypothetical protein H4R24_000384 [Coemansia sp. RSA 988]
MGSIYPAALSHFSIFCPALGPEGDNTHEQLLFYAAATLPAFYPYSPNDYFARNVHLRRRSSGGPHETVQTGRIPTTQRNTAASTANSQHQKTNGGVHSEDNITARERVVPLDTKLREIGLGAALIAFSGSFGAQRKRFHTVHSEKRRTLIFEPESGVIIQLSVVLPRKVRPYGKEKDAYSIEFLDAELSDRGLRAWLWQEYWAFRILFGPLTRALVADGRGRNVVKRQLDGFFGSTLWSWDQRWDSRTGCELDLLHALQPLPLLPIGSISLGGFDEFWHDLSSLTSTDSFSHQIDTLDQNEPQPLVHDAVVLWRGQEIVWSSWQNSHDDEETENLQMLRALVSWSRAVFAPVFDLKDDVAAGSASSAGERAAEMCRNRAHPLYAAPNSGSNAVAQPSAGFSTTPSLSLPTSHAEINEGTPGDRGMGGWSMPGSGWLWNWGGQPTTESTIQPTIVEEERINSGSDNDSRSSNSSAGSASADAQGSGGLAQVLSRAVNALVEPRPPTPPEVDPMFSSSEASQNKGTSHLSAKVSSATAAEHYTISAADIAGVRSASGAMLARDSDAESLRSVGSLASMRSTRTTATASVALNRQAGVGRSSIASPNRGRSNTIQHGNIVTNALAAAVPGWQPSYMRRRAPHGRAPSVATSAATAESVLLRDDTRVSSRSWWPTWMWGTTQKPSEDPLTADSAELDSPSIYGVDTASGIVPESTFLYTGDYPFPGILADQPRSSRRTAAVAAASGCGDEQTTEPVQSADDDSLESNEQIQQETVSQLGVAMEDHMPAAYEHGVGVDCSRGIVLAPRAIPGMLYDTRLVRTMFHSRFSARNAAERPLFVGADKHSADHGVCSRTLAYKYGDMLILVFGSPPKPETSSSSTAREQPAADLKENECQIHRGRRGRRAHERAKASKKDQQQSKMAQQSNVHPFSAQEAQDIEQAILRYAESLQAATWRDSREVEAQRKSEVQLAEQRRIPPYVYQSGGSVLPITRTSWRHRTMPLNRSYAGYLCTEMTLQEKSQRIAEKKKRSELLPAYFAFE